MTAAELDAFLRTELPQMFNCDDLTERRRIRSHAISTYSIPNPWSFLR
jgi:hypothetical protein